MKSETHFTSPQIEFLKNVIANSRTGNAAAIELLKTICRKSVDAAPVADLIKMGELLIEFHRVEMAENIARN